MDESTKKCEDGQHEYENCVCVVCGDEQHSVVDCVCENCGEEVHEFVEDVETGVSECKNCGKVESAE